MLLTSFFLFKLNFMTSLNLFGIPGLLIKELKQQIAKSPFSSLYSWLFKCVNNESKTILLKIKFFLKFPIF